MRLGRRALNLFNGRTLSYASDGDQGSAVTYKGRWSFASDKTIYDDNGLQTFRAIEISVIIGSGNNEAVADTFQRGGVFYVDVDGGGATPWTVERLIAVDAQGGRGHVRIEAVQPIRRHQIVGTNRSR